MGHVAKVTGGVAAAWLTVFAAAAQEDGDSPALSPSGEIGRIEFMAGCAQCHGISGRGDGVIAGYISVSVPNLTTIQRQNQGVFPARVIYEIVEGGSSTGAHGTREMPAWGDRYSAEAYAVLGWPHEPEEREAFIRARILALIEYIASIQQP